MLGVRARHGHNRMVSGFGGSGSKLSDVRPIGTRHKETSRRVSRSSRRFTLSSTNPSTIRAGSPEAAETASIFASSVSLSQPKWR